MLAADPRDPDPTERDQKTQIVELPQALESVWCFQSRRTHFLKLQSDLIPPSNPSI